MGIRVIELPEGFLAIDLSYSATGCTPGVDPRGRCSIS